MSTEELNINTSSNAKLTQMPNFASISLNDDSFNDKCFLYEDLYGNRHYYGNYRQKENKGCYVFDHYEVKLSPSTSINFREQYFYSTPTISYKWKKISKEDFKQIENLYKSFQLKTNPNIIL